MVSALLRLMRPRQWIKNSFVLAPLLFARAFGDVGAVERALFALVLFCIASSACYIVNDMCDVERDRAHPAKRARPLAAEQVSTKSAATLLIALYVVLAVGFAIVPALILPIGAYVLLNLAYSVHLKHLPVVDIFAVASGFVLRVWAGALGIGVPLSNWMAVTTLCLALYLAAIKRREELVGSGPDGRRVLQHYSVMLADRYAQMSAVGALIFYSLFVMSTNPRLVITIPLVLFGLYRYWFVVETRQGGEAPTDVLLTDKPLIAGIVVWIAICVYALRP